MRRQTMLLPLLTLAILVAQTSALGQTLTYVERSTGLQQPGMDAGSTELEFADVDADGHPDLVSVGDHGSPHINTNQHGVMVWFGDGAGNWSLFQYGNFGYGGVAIGDVNNDGLMDVGYGVHHNYSGVDLGDQILEVALGDGSGRFWTAWDDGLATNGETWGMFGTDLADVDSDGDLDVGAISFGCCAGIHVYLNNTDGTWTQSWGFLGGNSGQQFVFAEFTGDGLIDFAAAHGNGTTWFGDGAGGFTPGDFGLPGSSLRRGIAVGDVTDDGVDDLACRTDTGVGVYTWRSRPMIWQDISGSLANIGNVKFTQIADMNLDGHGDVLALFDGRIEVYAGDGWGDWQLLATIPTADACGWAAFRAGTDIDHNAHPDLTFVAEENCSPWTGGTNTPHVFVEDSSPTTPMVHPVFPRGGETLIAGSVRFIRWHAAVPPGMGQPTMTIELSTNGAAGPFQTIAADVPNGGRYQWLVPGGLPTSTNCYLRFTLDTSPPTIATTPWAFMIRNLTPIHRGDVNCDGEVDFGDINPFVLLLTNPAAWQAAYPHCPLLNGDVNEDGLVNFGDINPFVALLAGP